MISAQCKLMMMNYCPGLTTLNCPVRKQAKGSFTPVSNCVITLLCIRFYMSMTECYLELRSFELFCCNSLCANTYGPSAHLQYIYFLPFLYILHRDTLLCNSVTCGTLNGISLPMLCAFSFFQVYLILMPMNYL